MAVTHPTTVRNGLADYVVDLIDTGGVETEGILTIKQTSPPLDLVSIDFAAAASPGAFGNAASGIATANSLPIEGQVGTTGTADSFTIYDCDSPRNAVCSGSVTASGGGGDIELSSTSLTSGDYVRLTALTYESAS